ncbi:ankyrin repeat-containing domain protein [Neocallimastix lanati (nom. inval.)]|nr:ankyrin repeat-containing domain protein [Neocallimastix sp. JGI-2020a]
MNYANENNIILQLNDKNDSGFYPFLSAIIKDDLDILKLIIDYAKKNNIILDINEKDNWGVSPLIIAVVRGYEFVKTIMDYANENNIILNINEKDNDGSYPLLVATFVNKLESAKLIINYANANNITLIINGSDTRFKGNPMSYALSYNNYEMVKLLIDYGYENDIILAVNEDQICLISELDTEIIELLYKCYDAFEMTITFSEDSILLKKMKEIKNNLDGVNISNRTILSDNSRSMIEYHSNYEIYNSREREFDDDLTYRYIKYIK